MSKTSFSSIFQGIIFIILGIIAFMYPNTSLLLLTTIFQLVLLILGIAKLLKVFLYKNKLRESNNFYVEIFEAVVFLVISAIFYLNPNLSLISFSLVLGIWCFYNSILSFIRALRSSTSTYWLNLILSLLSLIASIIILLHPYIALFALTTLIAIYLISSGIDMLIYAYSKDNVKNPIQ